MKVKKLSIKEVKDIYRKYMVYDFPRAERKPMSMIIRAMRNGTYECLGIVEEERIIGYAFFVKAGNDYLFDYLATVKDVRNNGVGAEFLRHILDHFKDADSLFGEVEDSAYATDPAQAALQDRRLHFYLRNGFIDTGLTACTFGMHYKILERDSATPHTKEELSALYYKVYETVLPKKLIARAIQID